MIVRIAEIAVDPQQVDTYRAHLATQIEAATTLERGVVFLLAVTLADQPHIVRVTEGYADQAAYASQLTAPHVLAYEQATAAMVRSLRLIATVPIRLCAAGPIDG